MPYQKAKIYTDGSHYIAIPHEKHPERRRKKSKPKADSRKEAFEIAYDQNKTKRKAERTESIVDSIKEHFKSEEQAKEYVEQNMKRKQRNMIVRRVRLWRKVIMQEWHYFATFTYDDKKHTEESFKKSLANCLKHLANRKGWKYIGAWERSPENQRLHFHTLLHIPKGALAGEIIEVRDYNTKTHRMQTTYQNTYFNELYGRTDFKTISKQDLGDTVGYLIKYIEKTGERIVYSRNLPQYFVSDILDDDIVCPYGVDDKKLLLFDDFKCWDEGCLIGEVSPETIEQMPKSN